MFLHSLPWMASYLLHAGHIYDGSSSRSYVVKNPLSWTRSRATSELTFFVKKGTETTGSKRLSSHEVLPSFKKFTTDTHCLTPPCPALPRPARHAPLLARVSRLAARPVLLSRASLVAVPPAAAGGLTMSVTTFREPTNLCALPSVTHPRAGSRTSRTASSPLGTLAACLLPCELRSARFRGHAPERGPSEALDRR